MKPVANYMIFAPDIHIPIENLIWAGIINCVTTHQALLNFLVKLSLERQFEGNLPALISIIAKRIKAKF